MSQEHPCLSYQVAKGGPKRLDDHPFLDRDPKGGIFTPKKGWDPGKIIDRPTKEEGTQGDQESRRGKAGVPQNAPGQKKQGERTQDKNGTLAHLPFGEKEPSPRT
jgi:hypothetical protein